jgi:chromosome segregation ATPase
MNITGYEAEFLASREPSFQGQPPKLVKTPAARFPIQSQSGREFSPLLYTVKKGEVNKNKKSLDAGGPEDRPSSLLDYNGSRASFSDSMESFHDKSRMSSFLNPLESLRNSANKKRSTLLVGDVSSLPLKEQEKLLQVQQNEILGLKMKIHMLQNHLRATAPENVQQVITENVDLHARNAQLHAELADLKRINKELQGSHNPDLSNVENISLRKELQDTKELEDKISDLEYEIRMLSSHEEENSARIEELESENNRLRAENFRGEDNEDSTSHESLKQKMVELISKEEELLRRERELQKEWDDLERKEEELEHQKNELPTAETLHEQSSSNSLDRIQQLQDKIEDLEFEIRQLGAEKDSLEHRLEISQQRLEDHSHSLKSSILEADHETCQAEKHLLLDQISQLRQSLNTAQEELTVLQEDKDQKNSASKSIATQSLQLEDQIFKLEQEKIVLDRVCIT